MPSNVQQRLAQRIVYVDMSALGPRMVAFPLLYALSGDSLKDQADRLPMTWRALDPHLVGASVQGYNRLYRMAAPVGIVLAALGRQLNDAPALLTATEDWRHRLTEALDRSPEAAPAVSFFRDEYLPLSPGDRRQLAGAYLGKLAPFLYDERLSRMFFSTLAGLDLADVVARRQTVLFDFRGETNAERRVFKSRWLFDYIVAFIKSRGPGRHMPLSVHIDEITELTNRAALDQSLFANDLDELVNVYGRNYAVWLTLAHQELHQVSDKTAATLLTMGTQMIGVTANMTTVKALAEQFVTLDPWSVKRIENVWGHDLLGDYVIETRPVDMPLDQQVYLEARKPLRLQPFQFRVKRRDDPRLYHVNAAPYIAGVWPNEHADVLASMRRKLASRIGVPLADALLLEKQPIQSVTLDTNGNQDLHGGFAEILRDEA